MHSSEGKRIIREFFHCQAASIVMLSAAKHLATHRARKVPHDCHAERSEASQSVIQHQGPPEEPNRYQPKAIKPGRRPDDPYRRGSLYGLPWVGMGGGLTCEQDEQERRATLLNRNQFSNRETPFIHYVTPLLHDFLIQID